MLLAVALAYVIALLLPWDLGPWPALGALALALLLAGYGAALRAKLWAVPLALAAFFAGLEKPPAHVEPDPPAGLARVDGEVLSVRHAEAGVSAVVRVLRGEGIGGEARFSGTLRVRGLDFPPGTRARLVARVGKPAYFENPVPPGVLALEPSRVSSATLVGEPRVLEPAGLFSRAVHGVRARLRAALVASLSPEAAGVARALVLGESGAVDREAHAAIQGAGLSHVLAVSGLHVGLVGGGLFFLLSAALRRLGLFLDPVRVAAAASVPPTLAFALVAGGAPSAIRAGTMLSLALLCRAAGRRPRALATLGGAMLVFALISPAELPRPAFLLSVLATMSILTMPRPSAERWKALHVSWQLSWRTTLATAPIILLYFRSIPLSGLVSNLVLVPVASATLIPLALAQGALGLLGAGELSAPLFELSAAAFTHAARAFASLGIDVRPPPLTVAELVAVSAAGLVGLSAMRGRTKLLWLGAAALVGLGDEARLRVAQRLDETLRVTVLDVGQGSAAVIELPRGEGVIVADAGTHLPDTGERVVAPFLEARRHGEVRLFLASHAHPDHVGGLRSLHEAVPIRELWAPRESEGSFAEALKVLGRDAAVRLSASEGCLTRTFGEVKVEALAPCPGDPLYRHENEDSLAVRVSLGAHAVVLPGDVERRREAHLVDTRRRALRATLLVAPHHGSKTSSTEAFVGAVAPEVVFVSAGRMSRFGHPHEGPMRRFEAAGARAWVTSRHGGLTFVTDGRRYEVRASEGAEHREAHGEQAEEEHRHP